MAKSVVRPSKEKILELGSAHASFTDFSYILKVLPHRYPFLLVDRILSAEPRDRLVAIKNVTINEPFFMGHFPENPIMPGVLIVEALAQSCGLLASIDVKEEKRQQLTFFIAAIDKIRFRKPVRPGDQLKLCAEFISERRNIWKFETHAWVDDEVVAQGEFLLAARSLSSDIDPK